MIKKEGMRMSEYYHAFSVGFNWWYLVIPALALMAFFVGLVNMRREAVICQTSYFFQADERYELRYVWKSLSGPWRIFWAGAFATSATVLAVAESWRGIWQSALNGLTQQDSVFWGNLFGFVVVALFAIAIFFMTATLVLIALRLGEVAKKRSQLKWLR